MINKPMPGLFTVCLQRVHLSFLNFFVELSNYMIVG